MSSVRLGLLAAGCVAGGVVGGCETPPQGRQGGRVDPSSTTPAEAYDPRVAPADLRQFSDQLAQNLVRDLSDATWFPPAAPGADRATIVYGDIDNRTGIVSTADFEVVRERLKNDLVRSDLFRSKYRFLIDKAHLEDLRRNEVQDPGVGQRIDPFTTYLLNGNMSRIERGNTNYYLMTFELVKFTDGEIAWVNDYESKRWTN